MSNIDTARLRIEQIDAQMAELFEERMEQAKAIAEYKMEHGLSIKDKAREKKLIEKNCKYIKNDFMEEYYKLFIQDVMNISCLYQDKLMHGMKVAYCGVPGAYAHIAANNMFPGCNTVSYGNFADAYAAVERGEADCAVLPIENSYAGEVGTVIDLMFQGGLYINQIVNQKISHNLLVKENVSVKDIKKVISHQQALDQCAGFLKKNHLDNIEGCASTAKAAKIVAESTDPYIAAIASIEAGEEYGLKAIKKSIQDSDTNTTRFAAFSRSQNKPKSIQTRMDENFTLVFTVKHEPGALTQALNIIGAHGYNMKSLRSRPMKDLQWSYYFYIEAEGNINNSNGQEMLRELATICAQLKMVGSYYIK